jgi:hypothetical protein
MVSELTDQERARLERIYREQIAEGLERVKFATEFAQAGLKALVLANGGAIVALFTFLGNAKPHVDAVATWKSFGAFAAGLVAVLIAHLGAHISQNHYYFASTHIAWDADALLRGQPAQEKGRRQFLIGNVFQQGAGVFAVLSLAGFVAGSAYALAGVIAR